MEAPAVAKMAVTTQKYEGMKPASTPMIPRIRAAVSRCLLGERPRLA